VPSSAGPPPGKPDPELLALACGSDREFLEAVVRHPRGVIGYDDRDDLDRFVHLLYQFLRQPRPVVGLAGDGPAFPRPLPPAPRPGAPGVSARSGRRAFPSRRGGAGGKGWEPTELLILRDVLGVLGRGDFQRALARAHRLRVYGFLPRGGAVTQEQARHLAAL